MGLIRGALVTIFTILLFLSLFATASSLTISMSLNYNVIKPEVHSIVSDIILNQTEIPEEIEKGLANMQLYCQNNSVLVQENEDYTFELPCEVVNQGTEAIILYAIEDIVEETYYKEYDCDFMNCFEEEAPPFFLFSKHAQGYFMGWFYISLLISIALMVLLFFFIESKTSLPLVLGVVLIVLSFIFLGIGKLLSLIIGWEYAQIVLAFFTQSYTIFLIFLILGIVSIGVGIVLKFLSVGSFFARIFKKDEKITKKDLKEAIEENKKSKKKK